jgi:hypothetical protein
MVSFDSVHLNLTNVFFAIFPVFLYSLRIWVSVFPVDVFLVLSITVLYGDLCFFIHMFNSYFSQLLFISTV